MKYILTFCILLFMSIKTGANQLADIARVVDGDTVDIAGQRYRLHGIDTPEPGQKCQTPSGKVWKCGKEATNALVEMIGNKKVHCDNRDSGDFDRVIAVCWASDINLNEEMIRSGNAWAFIKYSNDYVSLEKEARNRKIGIWKGKSQPPWEFREDRWKVEKQKHPKGCPIKGNISKRGKIYHTPWSRYYEGTKVITKEGERWFCSEREALDAGWRAPLWGG